MNYLRRPLDACSTIAWNLLGISVAVGDLPRPGEWRATLRFRAEARRQEAARTRAIEEVRALK